MHNSKNGSISTTQQMHPSKNSSISTSQQMYNPKNVSISTPQKMCNPKNGSISTIQIHKGQTNSTNPNMVHSPYPNRCTTPRMAQSPYCPNRCTTPKLAHDLHTPTDVEIQAQATRSSMTQTQPYRPQGLPLTDPIQRYHSCRRLSGLGQSACRREIDLTVVYKQQPHGSLWLSRDCVHAFFRKGNLIRLQGSFDRQDFCTNTQNWMILDLNREMSSRHA